MTTLNIVLGLICVIAIAFSIGKYDSKKHKEIKF